MSKVICPGQDTRFWRPGDIFDVTCARCGAAVEFFKDEATRKCPKCGTRIQNPKLSLGCATWCEHARECLGFDPQELAEKDKDQLALVDLLTQAMKKQFGEDRKRIDHALAVLDHAEELMRLEKPESPKVVLAAALLHDIGIQEAEKKYGSSAGVYQEREGPPIAERIMKELGLDQATIEHVKEIVANHHTDRGIDTREFQILWDADWLVNLPEDFPGLNQEQTMKKIGKIFKTESGKKRAYELFIKKEEKQK